MYAKADNDPKPTDQDRPAIDHKMSALSFAQNALDEFPSARLSLTRLCPHRALFYLTVRVQAEHTEGNKSMIFRALASKNPWVWGEPQGALKTQLAKTEIANLQFLRFYYCQILRPSLTPI